MNAIELSKAELRRAALTRRRKLGAGERTAASDSILKRLLVMDEYKGAGRVLAYAAMEDEVQTLALLEAMLNSGKEVYLPYITGKREMKAVCLGGMNELIPGKFGIPTVSFSEQKCISPVELDCIIVPGVAFDRKGSRLGMGGGFYDTLLPKAEKAIRIALAFSLQITNKIPTGSHDCSVNFIITEAETIRCN